MNRIEMRDYYRKCAGLLSLMNAAFVFVGACLAIYIADFFETYADEGNALVALNGMYAVFVIGLVFAVMTLIAGIVSVKGHGEGVFNFQKFLSVILFALMLVSSLIAVLVRVNKEVDWSGETRTMTTIYVIVSILSVIFSVVTFIYAIAGSKYYDKSKSFAKDVPEGMEETRPVIVENGIAGICASLMGAFVAGMFLYFSNMIQYYDETMVENNRAFSGFFYVMFIVGLALAAVYLIISGLTFKVKNAMLYKVDMAVALLNLVYIVVMVFSLVVAMTQDFVKSQCPDVAYIIFSFVLLVIEVAYLLGGLLPFKKRVK